MSNGLKTGNTFDATTTTLSHAKKVWRRIDEQLPGGYMVKNVSSYVSAGLIPAGMPVAYSTASGADARDVNVITWSDVKTAIAGSGIDSLNIIGFTQEDVVISSSNTVGTCNVVVKGEIYGYMMGATVTDAGTISAAVKAMTQKNGLSIRVID